MKLTVDCVLTNQLSALPKHSTLARLLAYGQVTPMEVPLEALVCMQVGLQPEPDYPIAVIAADADGLEIGDAYWLRADPVHLVLQRDCFSLGEPIPLSVEYAHAERLIASLNQHFNEDGLMFFIGESGAWYLCLQQAPQIKTTLPSVAAHKNIHQFLPQGVAASKWVAMLNEVQMLLHEHPANLVRESMGAVAVNSIWLSGGGAMPHYVPQNNDVNLMLVNSAFYQGLAKWVGAPCQILPTKLDSILQNSAQHTHVWLQLPQIDSLDEVCFKLLLAALKSKKIKQLTLNLGFYEKCLIVEIKPLDTYKFWRNSKPVMHYLP